MEQDGTVLYVYRYRALGRWVMVGLVSVSLVVFAIAMRDVPGWGIVLGLAAVVPLVCGLFFRSSILVVTGGGLLVEKRSAIRVFGSSEFFPRQQIRHVRYWSEAHADSGDDLGRDDIWYYVDLVTMEGRIVPLLRSKIYPLDAKLGRRLAKHLEAHYEEYLADEQ